MTDQFPSCLTEIRELKDFIIKANSGEKFLEILQKIDEQQQVIITLLQGVDKDKLLPINPVKSHNNKEKVEVDYSLLENLLQAKKWQEADQETVKILLTLAQKQNQGYLEQLDLQKLPAVDLRIIDQMWLNYSNDRFGFSKQKNLYQSLGGTKFFHQKLWREFGEKIGWYQEYNWLKYEEINFTDDAPEGHLPILGDGQIWFVGGWEGSFKHFSIFVEKMVTCNL